MRTEKTYDKLAEGYDLRQNNPTTDIIRKKELKLLKRFVSGTVIDVGCGTGYHLERLGKGIGMDISGKMLKHARNKGIRRLIIGDADKTPVKDDSFGTVLVMFGALNFFDWRKAIKDAYRCLKPGGRIIVSVASEFDNGYNFWEKLVKTRPRERWIGIQKRKFRMKLFRRGEVVEEFRRNNFRLEHFDSALIYFKPRWGDFTPLSLKERVQVLLETILPLKDFGCIYFFVFRKV